MHENLPGLLSLIFLALIHVYVNLTTFQSLWHGRFLSFASGISFSYVFIDLLPTLEKGQPILKKTFEELVPDYFDRHVYVIALAGVLFFYGLHTNTMSGIRNFWLSMFGYMLFNFLVGASLADSQNPDVQPIILFTLAMGMHYFIFDHNATIDNLKIYQSQARWLLVLALIVGYVLGRFYQIPNYLIAIVVSFLAGGMILNALRYELPKRQQVGYLYFVLGAIIYSSIILAIGA